MGDLTRNKTLPDSSDKADFHALIDGDDGATIGDSKVTTAKIADSNVTTAKIADDNVTFAKLDDDGDYGPFTGDWSFNEIALAEDTAPSTAAGEMKLYTKDSGTQPELWVREESDGDEVQITSGGALNSGAIVQVVNTQTGAVQGPLATAIPIDDTIPQNTEGDEVMTLAITPSSETNKLKIEVIANVTCDSVNLGLIGALFQDSTANALAANSITYAGEYGPVPIAFTHYMTAGTTSETTFKMRVGASGGEQITFNGLNDARIFGGICASSITITEIVP